MTDAPKVFISYSHDSEEHQHKVLALSDRLRADGIDCHIDQYEVAPSEGWPLWMGRRVREAQFVLVVCTATYRRRFEGMEQSGVGRGVRWESMLGQQHIYDHDAHNDKFVPVVFSPDDAAHVPDVLRPVTHYCPINDGGYAELFRRLLNIPKARKPPLGELRLPAAPPLHRKPAFFTDSASAPEVSIARLPQTGRELFGRDEELALLDASWSDPSVHMLTLVAFGGIGKSALVNRWLRGMQADDYRGAERIYAWSFYSQGATQDKQASGDFFIESALRWFGDPDPTKGSPWDRGERLAQLVRQTRSLLILDGLEPLQHPPGMQGGKLRDPALQSLLRELAAQNSGLCVISTRLAVTDLEDFVDRGVKQVELDALSEPAGAELLRVLGVRGSEAELRQANREFGGHALALSLLGRYLWIVCGGEVAKRGEVARLEELQTPSSVHAQRVMTAYERWFKGQPELSILCVLGLFDGPAEPGAIAALRLRDPIPELTGELAGLDEVAWHFALENLRDARLLSPRSHAAADTLDCHPLVREHFGARLQGEHPEAWRAGHERLYYYFKDSAEDHPNTLQELMPLYTAVTHGCAAGRHQEALDEVYWQRISRRNEFFPFHRLGAFGADLACVAAFFAKPWQEPVSTLTAEGRAFLLNLAGFHLRALGRLAEAVEPMRAGLQADISQQAWKNAAISAGNLSQLLLSQGNLEHARSLAEQSVEHAGRSGDASQRANQRATLADALHQAGRLDEAEALFLEAEALLSERQSDKRLLHFLRGFEYCDLLLSQGQAATVAGRATKTLAWAKQHGVLLAIALDHLSLGRAELQLGRLPEASSVLIQALEDLRHAGSQDHLPRGLLARAELALAQEKPEHACANLGEALSLTTRMGTRLLEADTHLGFVRLHLHERATSPARESLLRARAIIEATGYHRRDAELAALDEQLEALGGDGG